MTNWLYVPEFSGGALQCHRLSLKLAKMGFDVEVLAGTDNYDLVGPGEVDGIPVTRVLRDKSSRASHIKYGWEIFHYIIKNKNRYDVIHSHGFHATVNLAARLTGIPLVQKITNLHVDDPLAVRRRRFGHFIMRVYQMARVVITTSGLLEEITQQTLPITKYTRIRNGVDTNLFRPLLTEQKLALRKKFNISPEKIVLISVGSLTPNKGLDTLLDAIKVLNKDILNKIELWVVGPQNCKKSIGLFDPRVEKYVQKIYKKVTDYKLKKVIRFWGNQERIYEFLQAADVYVHPSKQEGQPNALLEAMSCALPTVAHTIPGITDEIIQTGRFGYLVDCNDSPMFAAALRVLIKNPSIRERLGENARLEIKQNYDLWYIAQKYSMLYYRLTHNDPKKFNNYQQLVQLTRDIGKNANKK